MQNVINVYVSSQIFSKNKRAIEHRILKLTQNYLMLLAESEMFYYFIFLFIFFLLQSSKSNHFCFAILSLQHYYDTDLVFDDSSTLPSKASKPNTATWDLGASNVVVSDDDIEAADDDEDETPEEEAYENDEMRAIASVPQDESQNWLVRSVHRIKRSIDNLLSGNDKATKKPKKRKNPKKMVNGSKKIRDSDLIAGKKIGRKNPKSNEEKRIGKPKNVHRSQTGKRRGHEEALRLKRQYDGLADDEDTLSGSGGPLEIESENACKLSCHSSSGHTCTDLPLSSSLPFQINSR